MSRTRLWGRILKIEVAGQAGGSSMMWCKAGRAPGVACRPAPAQLQSSTPTLVISNIPTHTRHSPASNMSQHHNTTTPRHLVMRKVSQAKTASSMLRAAQNKSLPCSWLDGAAWPVLQSVQWESWKQCDCTASGSLVRPEHKVATGLAISAIISLPPFLLLPSLLYLSAEFRLACQHHLTLSGLHVTIAPGQF